ncbi:unnamed protein product [Rotaria socialis]|uniref:Major facilitator superfamily (MFS) profile domain-containing protein n=1 Tax=Rotaria socialis TaxID=392032 RepID=A0A820J2K2_9BILA|nr:unnamed protein product [Rotaria socialis]CAF3456160.1 unnamed protein product [Rotaria socialis]CAF3607604.1 unnamed protein product [Rotaria socialis]CAF4319154.1 unnamed protein product [Rotaria socialis]CAF4424641.1 unnamed protein product [Rotaria socialis]
MEQINNKIVPDGGWGWMIVLASFSIHFIMDGITYSMGLVYLEPMRSQLLLGRASVSTIFGILPAVTLGAGPIATVLTNMYGCRAVAIGGSCLASFGFLLSRLWANVWFYYITIGVMGGLGFALMYLPAIVSVGLYFEKKRTFAMGIAVCGSGVATSVFSHIMDGIVNIHHWLSYRNALVLEAGLILLSILAGLLMRPLPQEPSEQRRAERKLRKEAKQKQLQSISFSQNKAESPKNNAVEVEPMFLVATIEKSPSKSFLYQIAEQIDLNLLKNAAFALFTLSNFLASLGFNVVYNFAEDLANDANVIKDQRSHILVVLGVSNILGRFAFGFLGDRKSINRLLLFIITLTVSGLAIIAAPFCGSSVLHHIGYASCFGFFSGGYVTLTAVVLVDIVGIDKLSDGFGVLLLFVGIATAIGTPIVGAMREAFAHFTRPFFWPYFIFGGLTVLSGIILFAVPCLQPKKQSGNKVEIVCDDLYPGKDLSSKDEKQQNV